jgi:hypothetical protein
MKPRTRIECPDSKVRLPYGDPARTAESIRTPDKYMDPLRSRDLKFARSPDRNAGELQIPRNGLTATRRGRQARRMFGKIAPTGRYYRPLN